MGFFKRNRIKLGKSYDMAEAIKILSQEEYSDYTLIEDEKDREKFKIITVEESKKLERQLRENGRQKREFFERIQGERENTPLTPNYNNYQNAKKYNPNKWR